MNELTPMHYIMIALGVLALVFFILWLMANSKRNKERLLLEEQGIEEKEELKRRMNEKAAKEKEMQQHAFDEEKAQMNEEARRQSMKIESLKLLSRDGGEYLTDFSLIQLKERLVRNERIRPEDMHVLANIYLPGRDLKRTEKLAHLVLTRTGIYLLDSHYWKGHIYHGVDQTQFSVDPMFEHVFSLLDLDPYIEHSLAMERSSEDRRIYFRTLDNNIEDLKRRAELLQETLNLSYPVTAITYFNKEGHDSGSMNNYSRDKKVKVIVGEEELEQFFEKYVFHGRFQYSVDELNHIIDEIDHLNP